MQQVDKENKTNYVEKLTKINITFLCNRKRFVNKIVSWDFIDIRQRIRLSINESFLFLIHKKISENLLKSKKGRIERDHLETEKRNKKS